MNGPSSINTPNKHLITHKSCNPDKTPKFIKLGFKPNFPKSKNIIHVQEKEKKGKEMNMKYSLGNVKSVGLP